MRKTKEKSAIMSDLEQQTEEIEALSSIFPTEFKVIEGEEREEILARYPKWKELTLTNVITVQLQPQEPDTEGQIHGESICKYLLL